MCIVDYVEQSGGLLSTWNPRVINVTFFKSSARIWLEGRVLG